MKLIIPLEPPTVNHYKAYRVIGKHVGWYLTPAAKAWDAAVAIISRGEVVEGKSHELTYTVYQGAGSRGDVDNYAKCVQDSLVKAGVLKSDASIVALHAYKFRDRENPRTEITLTAVTL